MAFISTFPPITIQVQIEPSRELKFRELEPLKDVVESLVQFAETYGYTRHQICIGLNAIIIEPNCQTFSRAEAKPKKDPVCEECNERLVRYAETLDTGKEGWQCLGCGWSWDD
jgi:hypothetical protein